MKIVLVILSTIIFATISVFSMTAILYTTKGWFKSFFHDVLRWHEPGDGIHWTDGCSEHTKCRYCGKDIMRDSQGNWFSKDEY